MPVIRTVRIIVGVLDAGAVRARQATRAPRRGIGRRAGLRDRSESCSTVVLNGFQILPRESDLGRENRQNHGAGADQPKNVLH